MSGMHLAAANTKNNKQFNLREKKKKKKKKK
jgi:hypothetical protein